MNERGFDIFHFVLKDNEDLEMTTNNKSSRDCIFNVNETFKDFISQELKLRIPCVVDEEKCSVCKKVAASKYSHYGSKVCIRCRSFFQRNARQSHYQNLKCVTGDHKCHIENEIPMKRTCRSCRFQKCLDSGMKIEWLRPKKAVSVRNLIKNFDLTLKISKDEENEFFQRYISITDKACISYFTYLHSNEKALREFSSGYNRGEGINRDTFLHCSCLLGNIVHSDFIKELTNKFNIGEEDKKKLIVNNTKYHDSIRWSSMNSEDGFSSVFMNSFCQYGKINRYNNNIVNDVMEKIESEQNNGKSAGENMTAACKECLFYENPSKQSEFCELMNKKVYPWIRMRNSNALDPIIFVLMYGIMSTCPSVYGLDNPNIIEKIYNQYVWELYRYLKTHYTNESSKRLHNILMIMSYSSEINKIIS